MNILLGRKIGMSQIFDDSGALLPVTLVEVGPCYITQVKTEKADGYNAVQIGFSQKKEKHTTKPMMGHFKKAGLEPQAFLKEVRVDDPSKYDLGASLVASDFFAEGDKIYVSGTSKGKGFQGVVKRYHFAGGMTTHGQSDRLRAPGSIGQSSNPSRVFKGMRMGGQMGNVRVTTKNLKIVKIISSRNIVMIKGAIPGGKNALVEIQKVR